METSSLEKLIAALERGTKMHISILPLGRTGFCGKLALPQNHIIHAHPYCDRMKTTRAGLKKCLICKHFATRRAVEEKAPFCSYCIHGVWEAVVPVIRDNAVLAVIFVGGLYERPAYGYVPEYGELCSMCRTPQPISKPGKCLPSIFWTP